jgi:hypothetical protein
VASEEDEPTLVHAIVNEELRPPVAKVAHPLAVVVNLNRGTWAGRRCIPAAWRKPFPGLPSSP